MNVYLLLFQVQDSRDMNQRDRPKRLIFISGATLTLVKMSYRERDYLYNEKNGGTIQSRQGTFFVVMITFSSILNLKQFQCVKIYTFRQAIKMNSLLHWQISNTCFDEQFFMRFYLCFPRGFFMFCLFVLGVNTFLRHIS